MSNGAKVYPDFVTETGYGDPAGYSGPNCRHSMGAYLPGISEPLYTPEELEAQHNRDIATTPYKWRDSRGVAHERDFTIRDALDRQRELERRMRDTRREAKMQQVAGQDDEYNSLKARYRKQSAEYKRFSGAMGIHEQRERVYVDGLGRI